MRTENTDKMPGAARSGLLCKNKRKKKRKSVLSGQNKLRDTSKNYLFAIKGASFAPTLRHKNPPIHKVFRNFRNVTPDIHGHVTNQMTQDSAARLEQFIKAVNR